MSRSIVRALVIGAAATYVGSLHFAYADVVSPAFSYTGLLYKPSPDGSLVLAMILAVAPSVWLPIAVSRPSQVLLCVFYVLVYVPSIMIPYYVLGSGFDGVLPLTLAIAVSFVILSLMQKLRMNFLWTPIATMRGFENVVFGITVLLGAYFILAFGLRFELPNVADVYDVRATYNLDVADSQAPFVGYAIAWSVFVANPFAILLGLRARRYAMIATGLALEVLAYGITGYKSALLAVALVVPLYFLLRERRRPVVGLGIALAPGAVILLAVNWDQLTGSSLATSIFVRRAIMVPGQLVAYYYDFFSQNPTYALSRSILAFLGPAPYPLHPAHQIAAVYFHNPATSANANLWADGLAQFGFAGMIASTVAFGLILVVLDGAASGRDLRVTGAIAGVMAIPLSNSALGTTILSHGLALALLLVLLMPRQTLLPQQGPPTDERRVLAPS